MRLNIMATDELSPLKLVNGKSLKSMKGDQTLLNTSSIINQDTCDKNSFEISQEMCKDAMVEKIILISLAYLCTATEMRLIV